MKSKLNLIHAGKVLFSDHQQDVFLPTSYQPVKLKKNIGLYMVWINYDSKKELRNKVSTLTKLCGELLGR